MAPVAVGSAFAGHVIEELVGRGGMGVVYRAREIGLLLAIGWPVARTRRLLLIEGSVLALAGALLGMAGDAQVRAHGQRGMTQAPSLIRY